MPRTSRRRIPGIIAHRSGTLPSADIVERYSLRMTSPLRTMVDLAVVLPKSELEHAAARMERNAHVQPGDLFRWAEAHRSLPGSAAIRLLLAEGSAPAFTRSEAEKRVLELIRRARLPNPQLNARLQGYEVDFLWPNQKLVLEVDGFAYHSSARSFANDRRRDAVLTAHGYRVIRVTWNDVTKQPEATLAILAQALARASA